MKFPGSPVLLIYGTNLPGNYKLETRAVRKLRIGFEPKIRFQPPQPFPGRFQFFPQFLSPTRVGKITGSNQSEPLTLRPPFQMLRSAFFAGGYGIFGMDMKVRPIFHLCCLLKSRPGPGSYRLYRTSRTIIFKSSFFALLSLPVPVKYFVLPAAFHLYPHRRRFLLPSGLFYQNLFAPAVPVAPVVLVALFFVLFVVHVNLIVLVHSLQLSPPFLLFSLFPARLLYTLFPGIPGTGDPKEKKARLIRIILLPTGTAPQTTPAEFYSTPIRRKCCFPYLNAFPEK